MFLMFNGGDLLGRGLASLGPWAAKPPSTATLLAYALSRVALLVGLMFCNVITPHQWRLPRLIRSVVTQTAQHPRTSSLKHTRLPRCACEEDSTSKQT